MTKSLLKMGAIALCMASSTYGLAQNWIKTGASQAAIGANAAGFVACSLNDTIYASAPGNNVYNNFVYSTDKGVSWSTSHSILETDYGRIGQLVAVNDRVYAAVKLPSNDYLYYYSIDNGTNWVMDTVGLPHYYGMPTAQKDAFRLKQMGSNHILAFNGLGITGAYIKQIGDPAWHEIFPVTGKSHQDFTWMGNTWFTIKVSGLNDPEKLMKSTDNGASWSALNFTGLPAGFTPTFLESNHTDKLYMTGGIAGKEANAIYYSTDGGNTWANTNASAVYTDTNATAMDLFAIEDYVVAKYTYMSGDSVPRYLISSTNTPNFSFGDPSGFTPTNPAMYQWISGPLHFFNAGDALLAVHLDGIYSSKPGFTGGPVSLTDISAASFKFYPNPIRDHLIIENSQPFKWRIISLAGQEMINGYSDGLQDHADLSLLHKGVYLLVINDNQACKIIKD